MLRLRAPYRRLLLFAIRRMAVGGINDACGARNLTGFGLSYRRPLMLLRALTAEVSHVANATLRIAHCWCPRMTADESILLNSIAEAASRPHLSHGRLCGLLRVPTCQGVLASGEAVATAFIDLGMPLGSDCKYCKCDESFSTGDEMIALLSALHRTTDAALQKEIESEDVRERDEPCARDRGAGACRRPDPRPLIGAFGRRRSDPPPFRFRPLPIPVLPASPPAGRLSSSPAPSTPPCAPPAWHQAPPCRYRSCAPGRTCP